MHTASFGRVNSFYVRADLTKKIQKEMALLQNAEIVIHNSSPEGSLRGQASLTGVPAITIEIGDPQIFHSKHISSALDGVENILCHLNMYNGWWEKCHDVMIIVTNLFFIYSGYQTLSSPLQSSQLFAAPPLGRGCATAGF